LRPYTEVRAAGIEALAAVAVASGGVKAIAKFIDGLDDAKKKKLDELAAGGASAEPLTTRDSNVAGSSGGGSAKPAAASRSSANGARIASSSGAGAVRKTTSGGSSKAPGGGGSKPAKAAGPSSEADGEVTEGAPASKEELVEKMSGVYSAAAVAQLQSADWKQRLEGITAVAEVGPARYLLATSSNACWTHVSRVTWHPMISRAISGSP